MGIVLWSVSWFCGNYSWFACVLLRMYCFVECFLVLQKPLLVGLCVVVWVLFFGVFLGASRARTFHDIPQMESLLAGYCLFYKCNIKIQSIFLMSQFKQDSGVLNIPF